METRIGYWKRKNKIGNITAIIRLETYIGNVVDRKHKRTLQTVKIRNKTRRLERMNLDWKRKLSIN